MAVRKEEVQISIAFLTDESRQYAKLVADNQKFIKDLKQAQKEGKDLTEVIGKMTASGEKISKIPLDKLAPTQLIERARQLKQVLALIPQSSPQYKILEAEYKAINNQLAEMRERTKGVTEAQQKAAQGATFFSRALAGVVAVFGGLSLENIIGRVIEFGVKLFGIGTELEGMRQKTQTVFGEAAVIVEGFAEKNARALGLAKQDYLNLATAAGDLLVPMGFTQKAAADLSVELVNQGGILAAWSKGKVDAEQATEILQKALLGERDALNTLGIDIKQSLINDELKRRGLDNLTGESLRQAEALVTLEQITKQSAAANEDFEKSTGGLARQKAQLRAQISEITQKLAEGLLPMFSKLIQFAGPLISMIFDLGKHLFDFGQKLGVFKLTGAIFDFLLTNAIATISAIGVLAKSIGELVTGEFSKAWGTIKSGMAKTGSDWAKEQKSTLLGLFGSTESQTEAKKAGAKIGSALGDGFFEGQFDNLKKNGQREKKELEKQAKEALDARLKAIELAAGREEIALGKQRLDRQISESEFGKQMLLVRQRQYEAEMQTLEAFHQTESKAYLDAQKKLLEIRGTLNRSGTAAPLLSSNGGPAPVSSNQPSAAPGGVDMDEVTLREKFRRQVINELDFNRQLAALRVSQADEKLRMLQEQGLMETAIYKKTLDEKFKAQQEFNETVLENERRTKELKRAIADESLAVAGDALAVGIELLSKDEKARKKHAGAIKAFEIGQVAVNLASEIAGIWRNSNSNPLNALIPGWGAAFAVVQTALATGRAAAQTAKISAQKFYFGGFTGQGFGLPDSTGARPVGIVHEREWVAPRWMVENPVIGSTITALESVRQRGYAAGGMVNTTPVSDTAAMPGAAGGSSSGEMAGLRAEMAGLRRDMGEWARSLRVKMVYADLKEFGDVLTEIEAEAAL